MTLSQLLPSYLESPAPLTKPRAVRVIVMGRMTDRSVYFCRMSARGKGNAAARRAGVKKPKFSVV